MTDRKQMGAQFYIDDHALLYGLIVKAAYENYGELGDRASKLATQLYARERGSRMAKRALRDGLPLTHETYRMYTEWEDERKQMRVENLSFSPTYRMNGTYCVWNETWKKYHLERYGEIYCTYVDKTMVRTFNPDNELIIHSAQSLGGPGCDFEWPGLSYEGEEAFREAAKKKREKKEIAVKDFLYHCGHTLSAMGRGYAMELGREESDKIICRAMEEYKNICGEEKAAAVIKESEQDFNKI